jgi:hypothetical protein
MPTTGLDRQSVTAAPHPEEMKATLDLTIGNVLSVKATVRTTPAGLVAAALLAAAVLKRHAWLMNGGRIRRDYAKLCAPKWLLAERHQTPSSINGP